MICGACDATLQHSAPSVCFLSLRALAARIDPRCPISVLPPSLHALPHLSVRRPVAVDRALGPTGGRHGKTGGLEETGSHKSTLRAKLFCETQPSPQGFVDPSDRQSDVD